MQKEQNPHWASSIIHCPNCGRFIWNMKQCRQGGGAHWHHACECREIYEIISPNIRLVGAMSVNGLSLMGNASSLQLNFNYLCVGCEPPYLHRSHGNSIFQWNIKFFVIRQIDEGNRASITQIEMFTNSKMFSNQMSCDGNWKVGIDIEMEVLFLLFSLEKFKSNANVNHLDLQ